MAKGQHFNITVLVSFQTQRAWIQNLNNRKRITTLMHSDCTDDVFIEIHQVCDKIFTLLDSSAI